MQTTLRNQIHCTGTGLHSGKPVYLTLSPAHANTGILFYTEGPNGSELIPTHPNSVCETGLATTISNGKVSIATIEHLVASLRGLGVDNVRIHVEGGEVPIMDGSAADFTALITEVGLKQYSVSRKYLQIKKEISFKQGASSIVATPYDGFKVDMLIDFPHTAIGKQKISFELNPLNFHCIARARTFGFLKDIELLRKHNLALGGNLKNAIVLDEEKVINPEGLRYSDEFVRHKLLDFIGDMGLAPLPLLGKFEVVCPGHGVNNLFLRQLLDDCEAYSEVSKGKASNQKASERARNFSQQNPRVATA